MRLHECDHLCLRNFWVLALRHRHAPLLPIPSSAPAVLIHATAPPLVRNRAYARRERWVGCVRPQEVRLRSAPEPKCPARADRDSAPPGLPAATAFDQLAISVMRLLEGQNFAKAMNNAKLCPNSAVVSLCATVAYTAAAQGARPENRSLR